MTELTSAGKQDVGKPKAADAVSPAARSSGVEEPGGVPAVDGAGLAAAAAGGANERARASSMPASQVLRLQRSAGNHAVANLVRRQMQREAIPPAPAITVQEPPASQPQPTAPALIHRGVVQRSMTDSILESVAEHARDIPGYPLLTLILGKDPISGATVERTAVNVAHGILSVVPGGNKLFENLQQSGALERFFDWATGEFAKLGLSFASIKQLFSQAWDALSVTDLLEPADAWNKVKNIFGPPLGRIKDFAIDAGKKVLEFILEGVLKLAGPFGEQVMGMLKKGADVFNKIVEDPIGFLGNLLKAVKGGFEGFMSHILEHLKNGLMGWLFGALAGAGLTLPQSFDLKGILSIVLQVLGLTYQNLRGKLVAAVGEKTVGYIENAVSFVKTLVTEGLAGAWKMISEWVGNLWDMVIGAIQDWVVTSIVKTAVTKLVTMFNPVGAIVQGIITIYNTISFFIERAQQIAAVASSIFDSVGRIAAGDVGGAADFVEQTMAKAVPVMISFLANLLGLGGIADTIRGIIQKIQAPINAALDKVVGFITSKAKALLGKVKGLVGKGVDTVKGVFGLKTREVSFQGGGEGHRVFIDTSGGQPRLMVASDLSKFDELLDGLNGRLGEVDPAEKSRAEALIKQARPLGATVLAKANKDATAQGETAPDTTTPALEQLAPILAELFNLFSKNNPLTNTDVPWDPQQVKVLLSNLSAAVEAAKQARSARAFEDRALAAVKFTEAEENAFRRGEFGIGLAVYTDASDKVHRVAAVLNNIAIGRRENAADADSAFTKVNAAAERVLSAEGYIVLGGQSEGGRSKSGTHEEVVLRNYLQSQSATPVPSKVISLGVAQSTVCGSCVFNLATGRAPTRNEATHAGSKKVATGQVQGISAAEMQTIVVAGHDLATLLS